jgi:ABC-type transporter Mla subunit MlaD
MSAHSILNGLAEINHGLDEIEAALANVGARADTRSHLRQLLRLADKLETLRAHSERTSDVPDETLLHIRTCFSTTDVRVAAINEQLQRFTSDA